MKCPACIQQKMVPVRLEYGLPAMSCVDCRGVLVSILSYRDWLDRQPEFTKTDTQHELQEVKNTKQVITCPKCYKLMTKYRFSSKVDNQIDLCKDCGDVWFDNGEWKMLEDLGIKDHFTVIFNTPWQVRIREQEFQQDYLVKLEDQLGEQDFKTITKLKAWIDKHNKKHDIIHYLKKDLLL
ncbi:MAG: zf-TFIIB domain-containing protein [Gammaproteobacteria bacterium]|nr:zf-TFIIB domain-containing protein [Gammaproteobacteria bacterium]NNC97078.1 zf-TFIIB domain-containing protein [Gammaproteobacteria bacterium]NNM14065.1 zf-TFIIB domain-containing protein [Gammaproteobacteria bacterium]